MPVTCVGRAALAVAVRHARAAFKERVVGCYAIGSLAHGGFSALTSDVDVALVLRGPLAASDAAAVAALNAAVLADSTPLVDRTSVFWGSAASILHRQSPLDCDGGAALQGRLGPVDKLDWWLNGELVFGEDIRQDEGFRGAFRAPTKPELVLASASFAADKFGASFEFSALRGGHPHLALAGDAHRFSKTVLLPLRLLWTARTGEVGAVEDAAEWFAGSGVCACGAQRALVRAAVSVKHYGFNGPGGSLLLLPDDAQGAGAHAGTVLTPHQLVRLVDSALLPLYRACLEEYAQFLEMAGERRLALTFQTWLARIDASG
jgi:hypothetical protein